MSTRLIHLRSRVVVAMTTNIGFVTAPSAARPARDSATGQLALPFIRHGRAG